MRSHSSLVSIGLPVYNGERYLRQALRSLQAQTYQNIEIIICDDCSTDKTRDIVKEIQKKDPRIRYYKNATSLRFAANCNTALAKAKGEYFFWAADDDIWDKRFVERLVAAIIHAPSDLRIRGAFCHFDILDASGKKNTSVKISPLFSSQGVLTHEMYLRYSLFGMKPLCMCGIFETALLREVGGFDLTVPQPVFVDDLFMHVILTRANLMIVRGTMYHKREVHQTNYAGKTAGSIAQIRVLIILRMIKNLRPDLVACSIRWLSLYARKLALILDVRISKPDRIWNWVVAMSQAILYWHTFDVNILRRRIGSIYRNVLGT